MLDWDSLTELKQLDDLIESSANQKVIIFKHSTRCSISIMVKDRLERKWPDELKNFKVYYLDLLNYRNISNAIAEKTQIEHQSPQLLILDNRQCVYSASHNEINSLEIVKHLLV